MSEAPEWIYLDGDVEAGDGMFPRCFEDPKYASEPPIEYGRIDLLEAAEQRVYAELMEAERNLHEGRINDLEAKLAKAVQALEKLNVGEGWAAQIARTTLTELKGEDRG